MCMKPFPASRSAVSLMVAGLFAATSCGAEPDSPLPNSPAPEPGGDAPAEDAADPDDIHQFPDEDAEFVADLEDEQHGEWTDWEQVSDTELRFLFWTGNQSCYGQRYEVHESADQVAVDIITGLRPDGAEMCTQEALSEALTVTLEEPLGDREVVPLQDADLE